MADGEPALGEPADAEDDEVPAAEDDADDDALCPDGRVIPPAAGRLGRDPEPTDGTRVGLFTDGTDGVATVGVRVGGSCTGTVTGGGLGTVTVTGGGLGAVIVGTVTVGTAGVETVGVGTELIVGTVNAGLA